MVIFRVPDGHYGAHFSAHFPSLERRSGAILVISAISYSIPGEWLLWPISMGHYRAKSATSVKSSNFLDFSGFWRFPLLYPTRKPPFSRFRAVTQGFWQFRGFSPLEWAISRLARLIWPVFPWDRVGSPLS